ncbi:MAG TPA: enoyl-CoA hydratase family protein [Candidatus Polarisedimenticolia bacterium]
MSAHPFKPASFLYEESGPIARITLNRPDVLNALTFDTYTQLRDLFAGLKDRRELRVVILTGAGRAFCSGGDVKEIIGRLQGRPDEELLSFTRLTCETVLRMREAPQLILASLNGVTAGAGAALALASDFRIASDAARIAFLFVKVGLCGADMGVAHFLTRFIGIGRATELMMTGEFIDARTAEQWGLVNRVVPAADLESETRSWAETLAAGPDPGLRMTKEILNQTAGFNLPEALDLEARAQALCMKSPDFQEAYRAFLEKRRPDFARSRKR